MFLWLLVALLPYAFFPAGIEYRYTYLASVPFVLFAVLLTRGALAQISRGPEREVAVAVVVLVLVLALGAFLGFRSRAQQEWISDQARAYEEIFYQVPVACGELSPESQIFLVGSPVFDLYGSSTRMAMNLRYDQVRVGLVEEEPELSDFIEHKCVLTYDAGRYLPSASE